MSVSVLYLILKLSIIGDVFSSFFKENLFGSNAKSELGFLLSSLPLPAFSNSDCKADIRDVNRARAATCCDELGVVGEVGPFIEGSGDNVRVGFDLLCSLVVSTSVKMS